MPGPASSPDKDSTVTNINGKPFRLATSTDLATSTNVVDPAAATRGFADVLRVVRRRAGDPSFRFMARKTSFSVSTLTRAFSGEKFPKWPVVQKLLELFDVDTDTSTAVRRAWCQAANIITPIREDVDLPPLPEPPTDPTNTRSRSTPAVDPAIRNVCTLCGAAVVDQERHTAWHAEYIRRRTLRALPDTRAVRGSTG